MIGKTINNYLIERKLGEGGMGSVYLAKHKLIDRIVAIKLLHQNYFANESIRQRFKNEAIALIKLGHPNIVKIFDYVEQDQFACLIMEYIEGFTLDDYISKVSGPLAAPRATSIICGVLDAVQYAHDNNIFHRDIKPGNIMVSKDGKEVRIMDFGIAKITDDPNLKTTNANTQLGTPFYMSPEQVMGKPYTAYSDIYSLGVTLFEMATGKCPYQSITNLFELQNKIVVEPLPPTNAYYPNVPTRLQSAITIATTKVPENRFKSCLDFKLYLLENTETELSQFNKLSENGGSKLKKEKINSGGGKDGGMRKSSEISVQIGNDTNSADTQKSSKEKKKKLWVIGILLMVIAAIITGGVFYFYYNNQSTTYVDNVKPSTPTNLSTSFINETSSNLSWDPSSDNIGVKGYNIYRGSSLIDSTVNTSYIVTDISDNSKNLFTVKAKDAAGNLSEESNQVDLTKTPVPPAPKTSDSVKPTIPTNLIATATTETTTTLTWDVASDNIHVTGYNVYNGNKFIATTTGTKFQVKNLIPGNYYSFSVQSFDAANNKSQQSNSINVITLKSQDDNTKPTPIPWEPTSNQIIDYVFTSPLNNGRLKSDYKIGKGEVYGDEIYYPVKVNKVEIFKVKYKKSGNNYINPQIKR